MFVAIVASAQTAIWQLTFAPSGSVPALALATGYSLTLTPTSGTQTVWIERARTPVRSARS